MKQGSLPREKHYNSNGDLFYIIKPKIKLRAGESRLVYSRFCGGCKKMVRVSDEVHLESYHNFITACSAQCADLIKPIKD